MISLPLQAIRLPPDGIDQDPDRPPAVWRLDDDLYLLLAGRKTYLRAVSSGTPTLTVQLVGAPTLEAAREKLGPTIRRPLLGTLKRTAARTQKLGVLTPEEKGFLAGIEYAATGVIHDWPVRVYDALHGKHNVDSRHRSRLANPRARSDGGGSLARAQADPGVRDEDRDRHSGQGRGDG